MTLCIPKPCVPSQGGTWGPHSSLSVVINYDRSSDRGMEHFTDGVLPRLVVAQVPSVPSGDRSRGEYGDEYEHEYEDDHEDAYEGECEDEYEEDRSRGCEDNRSRGCEDNGSRGCEGNRSRGREDNGDDNQDVRDQAPLDEVCPPMPEMPRTPPDQERACGRQVLGLLQVARVRRNENTRAGGSGNNRRSCGRHKVPQLRSHDTECRWCDATAVTACVQCDAQLCRRCITWVQGMLFCDAECMYAWFVSLEAILRRSAVAVLGGRRLDRTPQSRGAGD